MTIEETPYNQSAINVAHVTGIVSAYVRNNSLQMADLPDLIRSVYAALNDLTNTAPPPAQAPLRPAVPVKRSISKEHLVCLEDGLKFKSLKRHLRSKYGLSPDEYRQKWNLPADYPMVAPGYSEKRSKLAKKMGLGKPSRDE